MRFSIPIVCRDFGLDPFLRDMTDHHHSREATLA